MTEPNTELPLDDTDLLVSRLIDGVFSQDERAQFEIQASTDPELWQCLATQLLDHRVLEDHLARVTASADAVELVADPRRLIPRHMTWTLAMSGWAAVFMLAITWASMSVFTTTPGATQAGNSTSPRQLTAEQHYQQYLQAPWVVGEQAEMITHSEVLPDGSTRIQFMRRILEMATIPPGEPVPTDQDGYLTAEPANLERDETP